MFSNQSIWLGFVLKAFDFNLGAKSLSKINFAFKNGLQIFIKQNPHEKILSATFPKILAKTKMSFTNLVSKVLFWKEVAENKVFCESFTFQMRNDLKSFSKLVLFSKKRGKQLFVYKTKMSFKIFWFEIFRKKSVLI